VKQPFFPAATANTGGFIKSDGCELKVNAELLFPYRVLHSLSQNVKADFPARRRRVQFRAFLKRIALRTL